MTDAETIAGLERLIAELRGVITVQRRAITDLDRQNRDLRETVAALMQPPVDSTPSAVSEMRWPAVRH